ncbi:MAG: histidinol dehydrogenase, partial [Marinilabiliales bacterium]|nr:histidinol dehydrogenase [Marinilabiliales bacterium]
MQIHRYPSLQQWPDLSKRAVDDYSDKFPVVQEVMKQVKAKGDAAVREYTLRFDKVDCPILEVSQEEILQAEKSLDPELTKAIRIAAENVRIFHEAQRRPVERTETTPGVVCWQKNHPIQSVGLYVPGGSAPLFSTVLMLALPASIAGCPEIILCSPPGTNGSIHPAILYAAALCKVTRIFRIGG